MRSFPQNFSGDRFVAVIDDEWKDRMMCAFDARAAFVSPDAWTYTGPQFVGDRFAYVFPTQAACTAFLRFCGPYLWWTAD